MPLQEAKISTNIRLRFRTHQENALILLAAGRTDYCLLGLDAGRVKFYFKIDDYMTEVPIILNMRFEMKQRHNLILFIVIEFYFYIY